MKLLVLVSSLFLSFSVSAQMQSGMSKKAKNQWIAQEAYNGTGGACDIQAEPHSYACTHWNFVGNHVFPLFQMDWYGALQGEWFSVTYVNPLTQNVGEEFYMSKNPQRPTQPMGVVNTRNGDMLGSMWINGDSMVWNNWLGYTLATDPSTFRVLDAYTVEMQAFEGQYVHLFRCRDFNRNDKHHFLCSWDLWMPENQQWHHKGYMGFLTRQDWDAFATMH